jgi:type IV pilus assembly protein PilE
LIEIMIAVGLIALLVKLALPSYLSYVQRSKIPVALDALSSLATRMEQRFQDTGNYGTTGTTCAQSMPTAANFTVTCATSGSALNYVATATGTGSMAGYRYTIDQDGQRATPAHPKGANTTCWTLRGTQCDS